MNKKATILTENVIFIILNLAFFAILLVFIYINSSPTSLMEQKTTKQIALLIDSALPGTEISLYVKDVLEKKEKTIDTKDAIKIDNENNLVIVKLSEKSYYEYAFFNDVDVIWGIDKNYLNIVIK